MQWLLKAILGTKNERDLKKVRPFVGRINAAEKELQSLSDDALKAKTAEFRARIAQGETLDDLMVEAFAVVKNACRRLCGTVVDVCGHPQTWDMVPFDTQLIGGIVLHHGKIAEMAPAVSKSDSQMRKNLALESARERARDLAEAQLAEFLNITTVFQSTTTMDADSAIQELIGPSGLSEVEYDKVGSVYDRVAKQSAWNKARGVTILQQWSADHPDTGQPVEGVILMWSPSTKRATVTGSALQPGETGNEQRDIKGPVRQGADFDTTPDL